MKVHSYTNISKQEDVNVKHGEVGLFNLCYFRKFIHHNLFFEQDGGWHKLILYKITNLHKHKLALIPEINLEIYIKLRH